MPFDVLWGSGSTWRWWGHLDTTCCNQTCLNFLHSEVVGTQKPSFQLLLHSSALVPLRPHTLGGGGILTTHALIKTVPLHPALIPWVAGTLATPNEPPAEL